MTDEVVVIKLDVDRQERWRYQGKILNRAPHMVRLEAFFNREDMEFHGIVFAKGDRFVESFYDNRWYNIFEIRDRFQNHLKGWYCNVCLPSEFVGNEIRYVDLALDLLVYPDGRQLVLDEDEFESLVVTEEIRRQALTALCELQTLFDQIHKGGQGQADPCSYQL